MKLKSVFLACLSTVALVGSSLVLAGNRPGVVTFSVGDAYYHFASKRNLQNIWMPNAAIAYNFDNHWAIEAGAGVLNTYARPPLVPTVTKSHGFLYTVDGLYRFNPCWRFEPYVSAGVGVLSLRPYGTDAEHQGNINAGLGTQFFASPIIAFRAEARDLYTITGGRNDFMINVGMSFLFGGENPPAAVAEPVRNYKGEG